MSDQQLREWYLSANLEQPWHIAASAAPEETATLCGLDLSWARRAHASWPQRRPDCPTLVCPACAASRRIPAPAFALGEQVTLAGGGGRGKVWTVHWQDWRPSGWLYTLGDGVRQRTCEEDRLRKVEG